MKIRYLKRVAAGFAIFLIAACGQDVNSEDEAATDEVEMSATGPTTNRDWIPAGVILPQPHKVLQDTKLGTRTHLLQISVSNDPTAEFAGWKSALEAAGYAVNEAMLFDGRLLFDGADVESGQISVSQPDDLEGYMIQIDVSKNPD